MSNTNNKFNHKHFIIITLITSIWVNFSELLRYFVYVKPEVQSFLAAIPNVATINDLPTVLIWGFFDTLLTGLFVFQFWLCAKAFGNNLKAILCSGFTSWSFFFVLFWVGSANMGLARWGSLLVILPLTLVETLVAAYIASKLYAKTQNVSNEKVTIDA